MDHIYIRDLSPEEELKLTRNADISIFLTNLSAYNEGNLIGEWVKLPCSAEDVQRVFERNHITNESGWFISDYDLNAGLLNMKEEIGMYANLDELNYTAAVINELSDDDYKKFECIVSSGIESFSSVLDYVTLAQNLDCFDMIPAQDDDELGIYLMADIPLPDVNDVSLSAYIDYEAIGRDFIMNAANCGYGTIGFCLCNQSLPDEKVEVPAEYRIISTAREAGNEITASEEKEDYEFER